MSVLGNSLRKARMLLPSLVVASAWTATCWAQLPPPSPYAIPRFRVPAGAGSSSGGGYTVTGTIGQSEAGTMGGGGYTLRGGFLGSPSSPTVAVEEPPVSNIPVAFDLHRAIPNPARDRTVLRFDLPRASNVRLALYDTAGRLVRTLADGTMEPGSYARAWDGNDHAGRQVPAGIYFARFDAGAFQAHQRIVRLR